MLELNVINSVEIDSSLKIDKLSKFINEPYVDPFEEKIKIELNNFKVLLKKETGEATKAYKDARKAYEKILEKFIKKNITTVNKFKHCFDETYESHIYCLQYESANMFIDKLMTLEVMIEDHELWIRNDMFDENEDKFESQ